MMKSQSPSLPNFPTAARKHLKACSENAVRKGFVLEKDDPLVFLNYWSLFCWTHQCRRRLRYQHILIFLWRFLHLHPMDQFLCCIFSSDASKALLESQPETNSLPLLPKAERTLRWAHTLSGAFYQQGHTGNCYMMFRSHSLYFGSFIKERSQVRPRKPRKWFPLDHRIEPTVLLRTR